MARLLYLVHRLPFPPNKGDKVRSFNLLRHLAESNEVFLGTFVDDADNGSYVDALRPYCAGLHAERLRRPFAFMRSLTGFVSGEALTAGYYRSRSLKRWVDATVSEQGIDTAVIFCSAMAQFVDDLPQLRVVCDLVDVDSAKWLQYAELHRWPLSSIYRRESRTLLEVEKRAVRRSARAFFVTQAEARLFRELAPECADHVDVSGNGVDTAYFDPAIDMRSPYAAGEKAILFTGAMDYLPNVDAVRWFAEQAMPAIRSARPEARFYIVGSNPTPPVRALAQNGAVVTGSVPDVRPYLRHADVVVAPLRIARGIQNKVLEAMAMARAVVISDACAKSIEPRVRAGLAVAADAAQFADEVRALLDDPETADRAGQIGRRTVLREFTWGASLAPIDRVLPTGEASRAERRDGAQGRSADRREGFDADTASRTGFEAGAPETSA